MGANVGLEEFEVDELKEEVRNVMIAVDLLLKERTRKSSVRDSYERQLKELMEKRNSHQDVMARLKQDMEKVKPPSQILQKEFDRMQQRDLYLQGELQKIKSDINGMNKDILTLTHQIRQLGAD